MSRLLRQCKLVALLELRDLFGLNTSLHTHDPKARRRNLGMALACSFVLLVAVFYIVATVYGLYSLGRIDAAPTCLAALAFLMVFGFGLIRTGGVLFAQKGYESLCSLPLSTFAVISGRFARMYVEDAAFTALFLLPGAAAYGWFVRPELSFYLITAAGLLLLPLFPLSMSCCAGVAVTAVSLRAKHRSLVRSFLTILLVVGIVAALARIPTEETAWTPAALSALVSLMQNNLSRVCPPAAWLGEAMVTGCLVGLLHLGVLSVASTLLFLTLLTQSFHTICRSLFSVRVLHIYRLTEQRSSGILAALIRRESKLYFSSTVYVTNTIIGPVLGNTMCVGHFVSGEEFFQTLFPFPVPVSDIVPLVAAAAFCIVTTTSCCLSIEGKRFWIIKNLPLAPQTILNSKLLWSLLLFLPFYLISEFFLFLTFRPSVPGAFWFLGMPALCITFSSVFSLWLNLHFYRFDWEKEEAVVKQSISTLLGCLAGILLPLIWAVPVMLCPSQLAVPVKLFLMLILLILTAGLYCVCIRTPLPES